MLKNMTRMIGLRVPGVLNIPQPRRQMNAGKPVCLNLRTIDLELASKLTEIVLLILFVNDSYQTTFVLIYLC